MISHFQLSQLYINACNIIEAIIKSGKVQLSPKWLKEADYYTINFCTIVGCGLKIYRSLGYLDAKRRGKGAHGYNKPAFTQQESSAPALLTL